MDERFRQLASGAIDVGFNFAALVVIQIDSGDPIALLAGVHAGCFELFGTARVRAIRDLEGKTVAVTRCGAANLRRQHGGSGQIRLRRIDGWRKIATVLRQYAPVAA